MADKIKVTRRYHNCPACHRMGTLQNVETQPDQGPTITIVQCRNCGWREEI